MSAAMPTESLSEFGRRLAKTTIAGDAAGPK